jgi:hypothetical protein
MHCGRVRRIAFVARVTVGTWVKSIDDTTSFLLLGAATTMQTVGRPRSNGLASQSPQFGQHGGSFAIRYLSHLLTDLPAVDRQTLEHQCHGIVRQSRFSSGNDSCRARKTQRLLCASQWHDQDCRQVARLLLVLNDNRWSPTELCSTSRSRQIDPMNISDDHGCSLSHWSISCHAWSPARCQASSSARSSCGISAGCSTMLTCAPSGNS